MRSEQQHEPSSARAFPTRRGYRWIALAFSAFAIYVSLIPFDLHAVPLDAAWRSFRRSVLTLASAPVSRSNFLGNILLFVPVGFFSAGALLADRSWRHAPAAIVAILAWALGVSFLAEFLQVYEPSRIPSSADVWALMTGASIGAVGWLLVGPHVTAWLRTTASRGREDRFAHALGAYVFVWIFFQLAPFDVTLDLGLIGQRLRALLAESVLWPPRQTPAVVVWSAAATIVAAVPLGMASLVAGTGRNRRRSQLLGVTYGGAVVTLTEVAQFVIRSHQPRVDDWVYAAAGVVIGAALGSRVLAERRKSPRRKADTLPRIVFAAWVLFVAAYHWQPYNFALDAELVRSKLQSISLVPLAPYAAASELNAFSDLLLKLSLSVPLGAAAGWSLLRHAPARVAYTAGVVLAGVLFAAIEAGQLLLPARYPNPSDVLTGVAGSTLGLWLVRWIDFPPPIA